MDEVTKVYLIGALAIAVGASGWLLPYKYNLLKLKHSIAKNFSESTNTKIARSIGAVLMVVGVVLIVGITFFGPPE